MHAFAQDQEVGLASYYHAKFEGKMTASGEIHDNDELTAAHRSLPFGSYLKVTNLSNMKSVVVRVTDRGPFRKKRVVDVSESAADLLGFIQKGVTKVRVEPVGGPVDLSWLSLLHTTKAFIDAEPFKADPPESMVRL